MSIDHAAGAHPYGAPSTPTVPTGLATVTQLVAVVWMVLAVARAVAAPLASESIAGADGGSGVMLVLVSVLASLTTLVQVTAWILAGLWLYLFVDVARVLNRESWHDRSAYWAVLGWVAPVVCLWFPYQVVRDAAAAVGSRTRLVGWWWAGWLVTEVFAAAEAIAIGAMSRDPATWLVASTALALATLVAGVLWIRLVRSMTVAARGVEPRSTVIS